MKKLILSILMVFACTSVAMAHCGSCGVGEAKGSAKGSGMEAVKAADKGSSMGSMTSKAGQVFDGLNLTDDQKAKLDVLLATKNKAIQAAKDEFTAGFKSILTPEQLKLFESLHASHAH